MNLPLQPTDEELMRDYLSGNSSAFETLYRRHSGRVYGYLQKRLQNRESADEVFQAVFLKFHTSRSSYDPKYPVLQWLFVIAKTALLDHYRKAGRQVMLADEEINHEHVSQIGSEPSLSEERELEELQNLEPEQRQAIQMRVIDELSYEEISRKLDRSQASVRQMVSRGLKKLRLLRGGA